MPSPRPQLADGALVMDAVAQLPENALFKYRLRTGAGEGIAWDVAVKHVGIASVKPMLFPEFWAPIGGFAGRRLPTALRLDRLEVQETERRPNGDRPRMGRVRQALHPNLDVRSGSNPAAKAPLFSGELRNRRPRNAAMERSEAETASSGPSSFLTQAKLAYEYSMKNFLWKQGAWEPRRIRRT
eukprot:Skav220973  [mRNA]  locus=scaffold1928:628906:637791:- [translate_table: standard]